MKTRDVGEVSFRDHGNVVTLSGTLLVSRFVSYLVPSNSARSMNSTKLGLRVVCPGLAAEVLESDLARITNGQPECSIGIAALTGVVSFSEEGDSERGTIEQVSEIKLRSESGEVAVDLSRLTTVSNTKMENVKYLQDEALQADLLEKYTKERLR